MANYQLGPVIGKIGGADVQKIPVEAVADGGNSSRAIMHTVHVPEGETWLVALTGDLATAGPLTSSHPEIFIGEVSNGPSLPSGRIGVAAEVTGTAEITLKRNTSGGSDRFSGHVHTVPMPD